MKRQRLLFITTVLVASCSGDQQAADTAKASSPAPRAAGDTVRNLSVSFRGIGALEAGMNPTQAYGAMGIAGPIPAVSAWKDCDYASLGKLSPGVSIMVENGTIARVEVKDSLTQTAEGAHVGDSEARIHALYGNRVEVQPHKYIDGHYLIVRSSDPRDSLYRLVFETDGKAVLEYRSGRTPPVHYVEGCA
jgi:hypothetical protein